MAVADLGGEPLSSARTRTCKEKKFGKVKSKLNKHAIVIIFQACSNSLEVTYISLSNQILEGLFRHIKSEFVQCTKIVKDQLLNPFLGPK